MSEEKTIGIFTVGLEQPIRCLFPNLFTPRKAGKKGKERGEPKYSIVLTPEVEHPEVKALKQAALAVAKAKWPGRDINAEIKAGTFKWPFQSADKAMAGAKKNGHDGSFYEGYIVLKTSSKFAPAVLDGRTDPPSETLNQKLVYSGCYVAAEINFVAYDKVEDDSKDGVTAYVNAVCFVKDGKRIGGKDHAQTFRGIKGRETVEDPTEGMDDEEI